LVSRTRQQGVEVSTTAQPTEQEVQQVNAVSQAGADAAAKADTQEQAEQDATKAMKAERDTHQLDIPDEVIEKIAKVVSARSTDEMIAKLKEYGAFDSPPEPVKAPESAQASPQAASAPPGDPAVQAKPEKSTWADRFCS